MDYIQKISDEEYNTLFQNGKYEESIELLKGEIEQNIMQLHNASYNKKLEKPIDVYTFYAYDIFRDKDSERDKIGILSLVSYFMEYNSDEDSTLEERSEYLYEVRKKLRERFLN